MKERQQGLSEFLIARGKTAKVCEGVEAPCHLLPEFVEVLLSVSQRCPVALWWEHWHDVLRNKGLADASAVIPLVPYRRRSRRRGRHGGPPRRNGGTLRVVPGREDDRATRAFVATPGMDVRGPTVPRTAQSLCGVPAVFCHAPAACGWARTMVASMTRGRVVGLASVWRRSQRRRQIPRRSPRRTRLKTASQGPNAAGRARHGVPVRARGRAASRHSRSRSTGGHPAGDVSAARRGGHLRPRLVGQ
jgi:hypothetical protein